MTDTASMPQWDVTRPNGTNSTVHAATARKAVARVARVPQEDLIENEGYSGITVFLGVDGTYLVTPAPAEQEAVVEDDRTPVILAVHNGVVQGGQLMFNNTYYAISLPVLQEVQRLLSPYEIV